MSDIIKDAVRAGNAPVVFQIKQRFTDDVLFECELPVEVETQSYGLKLGFAVNAAVKAGANLAGAYLARADLADADLSGAYLAGANLAGADLVGANLAGAYLAGADLARADLAGADLGGTNLVDAGQRSDGYRFIGWVKNGVLQIRAGCHDLSIIEARKHWAKTRGRTQLGDETMVILDHIERVAKIRGLLKA
jgi:hypothetical protein